jgi:SNF2 family DNA or RNA helicase
MIEIVVKPLRIVVKYSGDLASRISSGIREHSPVYDPAQSRVLVPRTSYHAKKLVDLFRDVMSDQAVSDLAAIVAEAPNAMHRVVEKNGKIFIVLGSFVEDINKVKGARWKPNLKAYEFPASPMIAESIAELLSREGGAHGDRGFYDLLERHEEIKRAQAAKTADDLPKIPIVVTEPWDHQLQAFWFASKMSNCMLAMGMGTGKTKVTIDLVVNEDARRVLILCPKYVVSTWVDEFEMHAPGKYKVVAPSGKKPVKKRIEEAILWTDSREKHVAVVLNYETLRNEEAQVFFKSRQWKRIVLDESQRIKAPAGIMSWQAAALRNVGERRLCLTGTPMPNSFDDIYAQFRFLEPGVFGLSHSRFKREHLITDPWGKATGLKDKTRFEQLISSVTFRAGPEVLDLPDLHTINIYGELEPKAKKIYAEFEELLAAEIRGGVVTLPNAAVKLLRLCQLTGGFVPPPDIDEHGKPCEPRRNQERVRVSHAKQNLLKELLLDLGNEPVVVFCRFIDDINVVHEVAKSINAQSLEISGRAGGEGYERWKRGEGRILVGQIKAASEGIKLIRSRYGIYYSHGFSLGEYEQSTKRMHRPGQKYPVTLFHLLMKGTVDQYVKDAIDKKRNLVESVLHRLNTLYGEIE